MLLQTMTQMRLVESISVRRGVRLMQYSFLVFHGGSGSSKDEIREAVTNGVIKMNVDTDTQASFLRLDHPIPNSLNSWTIWLTDHTCMGSSSRTSPVFEILS